MPSNKKFHEDLKDKNCSPSPSNDTILLFLPFPSHLFHQRLNLQPLQKHTIYQTKTRKISLYYFMQQRVHKFYQLM